MAGDLISRVAVMEAVCAAVVDVWDKNVSVAGAIIDAINGVPALQTDERPSAAASPCPLYDEGLSDTGFIDPEGALRLSKSLSVVRRARDVSHQGLRHHVQSDGNALSTRFDGAVSLPFRVGKRVLKRAWKKVTGCHNV